MNDDGTMARLPDLVTFAQFHGFKIATIADLIAHRRRTESVVQRAVETSLDSRFGGGWRMIVYTNRITYAEHVVLVKGAKIGRASCRESVCQYVSISVVAVTLKKKNNTETILHK